MVNEAGVPGLQYSLPLISVLTRDDFYITMSLAYFPRKSVGTNHRYVQLVKLLVKKRDVLSLLEELLLGRLGPKRVRVLHFDHAVL